MKALRDTTLCSWYLCRTACYSCPQVTSSILKLVATSFLPVCLYQLMLAGRKHEVSVGARQMSVARLITAVECGNNIAFSADISCAITKVTEI